MRANDSIMFAVKHYNPDGGPMSLKIVKNSGSPTAVSVMMDGKMYNIIIIIIITHYQ